MSETAQPVRVRGWQIVGASWHVLWKSFGLLFLAHFLFQILVSAAGSTIPVVGSVLLAGPLWFGCSKMSLAAVRGQTVAFEDLFDGFHRFPPTFFAGLLMTLIAMAGTIVLFVPLFLLTLLAIVTTQPQWVLIAVLSTGATLCLLPTCAVTILYAPTFFLLVDKDVSAWTAMEMSRKMVWGNWAQWVKLWVPLSILHLAGLLLCCVGIFVATPWMIVALAMTYELHRADTVPPTAL